MRVFPDLIFRAIAWLMELSITDRRQVVIRESHTATGQLSLSPQNAFWDPVWLATAVLSPLSVHKSEGFAARN
jgi:hypothetical protein